LLVHLAPPAHQGPKAPTASRDCREPQDQWELADSLDNPVNVAHKDRMAHPETTDTRDSKERQALMEPVEKESQAPKDPWDLPDPQALLDQLENRTTMALRDQQAPKALVETTDSRDRTALKDRLELLVGQARTPAIVLARSVLLAKVKCLFNLVDAGLSYSFWWLIFSDPELVIGLYFS